MKKLIVIISMLVVSIGAMAVEPFFPTKKGMVLEYADKNSKGKIQSYSIITIQEVDYVDEANMTVTYKLETLDEKKNPVLMIDALKVKIEEGYVHFDPTSNMGQIMEGMEIKGRGIILPSDIKTGDKLDDYNISVAAMAMEVNCTNINVTANENIDVDGTSYDCFKVETAVNSKVVFLKTQGTTSVWYARGIGDVKTETYDKKGKLLSSKELISVK